MNRTYTYTLPPWQTRFQFAGAALAVLFSTTVFAAPLLVEQEASTVGVSFTQMGVSVDAQFQRFDAEVSFDPATPAEARAKISIDTASFDFGPGAGEYNEEVRKEEWFDTDKHPQALFQASGAAAAGPGRFTVPGELTIKGITKEVTAAMQFDEKSGKYVFSGEVPIKRLDYGIGATEWKDTSIVADEVIVKFVISATQP